VDEGKYANNQQQDGARGGPHLTVNRTLFMHNRNIDDVAEHWDISYFLTFAVLTVATGNGFCS
jgi:hypothetical protein